MLFFFFQAEDGIRDLYVTGVQTCALPIFQGGNVGGPAARVQRLCLKLHEAVFVGPESRRAKTVERSEERRVGKSVDLGGRRIIKKKKRKKINENKNRNKRKVQIGR